MSAPYGIISDLHLHSWSAFSEITPEGENTRHIRIMDAIREAFAKLRECGGHRMFIAGDIFHKRGEIAPAILNPSMDLFKELIADGFEIFAIPGNHDLTANDSQRVGNSVTALETCGVIIAHEPMEVDMGDDHKIIMFPWFSTVAALTQSMDEWRSTLHIDSDGDDNLYLEAIIHAPIDGVLPHLPSHGLAASALAETGFNRVFSGHYHNHKDLGDDVYSVGALTHQTWGDIGSLAGYIIVDGGEVTHYETSHPKFVDLSGDEEDSEAAEKCDGNYVRVRGEFENETDLKEIRQGVLDLGALGVTVIPIKTVTVNRAGETVTAPATSASLDASITGYLTKKAARPEAHALALDILSEARAA